MESGLVLSHAKQKKLHRAATRQRWQKLPRLFRHLKNLLPPTELSQWVSQQLLLLLGKMSPFLITPVALERSSPALHKLLFCPDLPTQLGYFHPYLPEVNHLFLGHRYSLNCQKAMGQKGKISIFHLRARLAKTLFFLLKKQASWHMQQIKNK